MTVPSSLSNLNLTTFNKLYPLLIQKYNTLIPDPNANILDKINSIVDYLNSMGNLSNEVVDNWNKVMAWVMSDGLTTDVNNKIEAMNTNGEFNSVLNSLFNAEIGDLTTLTTTDKSKIVNAINEVEGNTKTNAAQLADIALNLVRKYGADSTGTQDSTNAINQAILDASNSNGIVYIPKGTFLFSEIHLKNNVKIIGAGRNQTTLTHTGSARGVFNNETSGTALGNIQIADLTLNMNTNTTIGIDLDSCYMTVLERLNINGGTSSSWIGVNFGASPTKAVAGFYNSAYDVSIGNGGSISGIGFMFQNGGNSNRLNNCRTNGVSTAANINNSDHIVIMGCSFEQFNTAINYVSGIKCVNAFNRMEVAGSLLNTGVGVQLDANCQNIVTIGNAVEGVQQPYVNNASTGVNFLMNYSSLSAKYFYHESGGGWETNMVMNGYAIQNVGQQQFAIKTGGVVTSEGYVAYADGVNWNPGAGKGLYIHDGTNFRKIAYGHNKSNVVINASSTSYAVPFTNNEADTNYSVLVSPGWNTTYWITNKATNGFTINFGTPPASNSTLDWTVRR